MKIIFCCKVHALLCEHNIEYDDSPSLCNIMCNENMKSGILIDYDSLSSQWQPCMPGTDRMGTIPFMAIGLLTDEYWNGLIEQLYWHDLEAFIWILPFVFFWYQNGKSQQGTLVKQWMTSNYITCCKEKSRFQNVEILPKQGWFCQPNSIDHWELVESLLLWKGQISMTAFKQKHTLDMTSKSSVASIWLLFIQQLRLVVKLFPTHLIFWLNWWMT